MELFIKEWANVLIFTPIALIASYMFKKSVDTYTKKETESHVDLRLVPVKELLDRNSAALESLQVSTIIAHAEMNKSLSSINTELATMAALRKERQRRHNDEDSAV